MSTSWYTPAGASDDWMITEAIVIPDTATSVFLSWDAEAIDPAFRDGYEVYISNTNQTIAAAQANPVLFSTLAENSDITTRKVNISSYKGDTVYDIVSRDTLTSVTAVLRGVARAGRTASVSVREYNNAPASAPLATSKVYNVSAPGTYNFILSGGVDLTPGKYLVTIDELDSTINSATINEYAVTITDMLGKVVESHTGLPNGEFNFDLSNQPNGMYFVRVNSGDAVTSLKLVLNK